MNHVMIDLETLGVKNGAPIISIGAVFFDPDTGDLGGEYHRKIKFESSCEKRVPDASTIRWWMQQSDEARMSVLSGGNKTIDVLKDFCDFLLDNAVDDVIVWGNGASFDISILESALNDYEIKVPWKFWNVRDVRTVVDMASRIHIKKSDFPFDGIKHNALADAKHQANYVSIMWQELIHGE